MALKLKKPEDSWALSADVTHQEETVPEPAFSADAPIMDRQGPKCAGCGRTLASPHYLYKEQTFCRACADEIQMDHNTMGRLFPRLLKSTLLGGSVGAIGCLLYFFVAWVSGMQIGALSWLIGLGVGWAVLKGSENRGGVEFQILASVLTYCSIALSYIPLMITGTLWDSESMGSSMPDTMSGWAETMPELVIGALLFPVSGGLIGLIIIGIGVFAAFMMNKDKALQFNVIY